jgi:exosortase
MYWMPIALSLGYLWFRLIDNLWPEWITDPQYSYGMIVPLLCLGLILRRRASYQPPENQAPDEQVGGSIIFCLIALFAFLYLPIRLVEAATPEWRIIQWVLGIVTIGLTLSVLRMIGGRGWLLQLAFPIVFFLVAIPWPTIIETPVIQTLTRASASVVMELLYLCGVPALLHGNLIQVGTGVVGIDEACSGIRSFQTSLMTCLFFGEFYRLRAAWRWGLIPIGFGLALAFNIGRMFFLTMVAAKKGVAAISQYHDPAGVSTAIFCTLILWFLALLVYRRQRRLPDSSNAGIPAASSTSPGSTTSVLAIRLGMGLLIWLVLVEAGVKTWYRSREANLKPAPSWTLHFPGDNPSVKVLPIDEATRNLLRYDEGRQGNRVPRQASYPGNLSACDGVEAGAGTHIKLCECPRRGITNSPICVCQR